jgi:hypothetical protein
MANEESIESVDNFDEVVGGAPDSDIEESSEVESLQVERRPGAMVTSPSPSHLGDAGPTRKKPKDWKFWKKDQSSAPKMTKTGEKRPVVSKGKRVSTAPTISDLWSGAGGLAVRSGKHAPLGRLMQWQAPVAGEMLDEAVKGTIVDRMVLQPVAKGRGRFDALGAVFGPPLIVMAIERNPQNAEMLIPMLKASIRSSLPLMVPAIKKVAAREAAAAEAARELFPDLGPGEDPVDSIIAMMFADWTPVVREPAEYAGEDATKPS